MTPEQKFQIEEIVTIAVLGAADFLEEMAPAAVNLNGQQALTISAEALRHSVNKLVGHFLQ